MMLLFRSFFRFLMLIFFILNMILSVLVVLSFFNIFLRIRMLLLVLLVLSFCSWRIRRIWRSGWLVWWSGWLRVVVRLWRRCLRGFVWVCSVGLVCMRVGICWMRRRRRRSCFWLGWLWMRFGESFEFDGFCVMRWWDK